MKNKATTERDLKAIVDFIYLRSRSHYPVQKIIIYKKHINIWDEICVKNELQYAVIRGFCGNDENGTQMLIGCKKENFLQLSLTFYEFDKRGCTYRMGKNSCTENL